MFFRYGYGNRGYNRPNYGGGWGTGGGGSFGGFSGMGITEILRRIWLFSANKIESSESFSKQPKTFEKIETASAIFWDYLGMFREYGKKIFF